MRCFLRNSCNRCICNFPSIRSQLGNTRSIFSSTRFFCNGSLCCDVQGQRRIHLLLYLQFLGGKRLDFCLGWIPPLLGACPHFVDYCSSYCNCSHRNTSQMQNTRNKASDIVSFCSCMIFHRQGSFQVWGGLEAEAPPLELQAAVRRERKMVLEPEELMYQQGAEETGRLGCFGHRGLARQD